MPARLSRALIAIRVLPAVIGLALLAPGCRHDAVPAAREEAAPAARAPAASHPEPAAPANAGAGEGQAAHPLPGIPSEAAVEVIDLESGRAVFTQRPAVLDTPAWMASVAKVFTLRAALDAGVVDARTRIPCDGRVTLGSRTLQCVHPPFGRPLSAVEALAHSCNAFFASLRIPSGAIAAAFTTAGLPPPSSRLAEPRLAWVGLDGERVAPRRTLRAFVSVVTAARRRGSDRDRLLLDGLHEAARSGTAAAFGEAGIDALAKTGTAALGGGVYGGLVVAVTPADAPRHAVVALGAGIAGRDAAAIAAAALTRVAAGGAASHALPASIPGAPSADAARDETGRHVVRLGRLERGAYRVDELDLERYVAGVVAAEAPPGAPAAALEALAIAARSYGLAMAGRHAAEGFDLCDLTHCQAWRDPDPAARQAARATAGRTLRVDGAILPAFHHASCGGALEAPAAVWGEAPGAARVMRARPDPAAGAHDDRWSEQATAAGLRDALRAAGHRGDELRSLTVVTRTPSGRVARLHASGLVPTEIDGERFRLAVGRHLGWQVLKSSLYEVTRTAHGYRFDGRGRGHGVGLCVTGALQLAARGEDAAGILDAYFPGAQLTPPTAAPPQVRLPATREGDRARVEAVVAREADAVRRASGETWPAGSLLVFHDSVEEYQRASGQPWWTAGAARDGRIDLLPIDVLRRRGTLERTVRHELAHLVTARALSGRPRWVQEGVARHVAGDRAVAPATGGCPPDEAFASAASARELESLYDQALACVERALGAAGGNWRAMR